MRPRIQTSVLPWLYLFLLVSLNAYICQEAFFTESTGHFYSMHGVWMALARITGLDWWRPRWWPYWGGGSPNEYPYAVLIPAATATIACLLHVSVASALHALTGFVYCLGPALLYIVSWKLLGSPGYSFAAALVYSLLSPTQLVVPDPGFHAAATLGARRLYLMFAWDDLPHMTSLALLPVAVFFLAKALQRRRWRDRACAALAMAVMMLANMFGMVLVVIATITVPLALKNRLRQAPLADSAIIAAAAYILVCPWLPPSLLLTIRRNAALDGEADTWLHALIALAITTLASAIVWRIASRRVKEWPMRWLILFACPMLLIPVLAQYWGPHFVPQSGRYRCELELVLAWLSVFALRPLVTRIPRQARVGLALVLSLAVVWQVVSHRRLAIEWMRPVDVSHSLEYRSAKWVGANLPGQRVMMGGSMGFWLDTFTDEPESVAPYSTAMNWTGQVASYTLYSDANTGDRAAEYSVLWLQAMGVQAVAVPGPRSPDAWRGFVHPYKFEGVLPVLWREDDTAIYRVPQVSASLAHVMLRSQLVQKTPRNGLDTDELRTYVAALENNASPSATLFWRGPNRAEVHARLKPSDVIATQINYHPGWHALAGSAARAVHPDGLGFLIIDPQCAGDCELTLEFDGGVESKVCRAAFLAVWLVALLAAGREIFLRGRRAP